MKQKSRVFTAAIHIAGILIGLGMSLYLLWTEPFHIFLIWSGPFWYFTTKSVLDFSKQTVV